MPEAPPAFALPSFGGRIGVARKDITPPVGIYARNWGAAAHDVAEGVHRPLTATALTLQQSDADAPLVLLSLDLGWWRSFKDEAYVRGFLLDALNLSPDRLLLHLTHTHAGPVLCREEADKPGGTLIAPYLDTLRDTLLQAVQEALASAVPATLDWSAGRCGLAQNRDLPAPDSPRYLCGFRPGAAADDTLLVGRVTTAEGQWLGTLVNYACHPTTLAWENRLLSPDFVGAMRETIEARTDGAPCLFLQGASGELAPREQYTADTDIADRHGRQLGYAALATLEGMLPPATALAYAGVRESGAPLALWERRSIATSAHLAATEIRIELPLKPLPSLSELDAEIAACTDRVTQERLNRKRRIREGLGDGTTAAISAWIWRIGDVLLVAHPNEAYSPLQTALRERFPHHLIVVLNVTNGYFGYLPPTALYGEDMYAVWQSPFAQGCLERTIEALSTALHD